METLQHQVETILFIAKSPIKIGDLQKFLDASAKEIKDVIDQLKSIYQDRAVQILEIAGGYQMGTRPQFAEVVEKFVHSPTEVSLTPAALEALAIIAYRQPVSKVDIEAIRGVNSDAVVKSLLDKGLIEELGKSETVGRPMMYGTTDEFLKHFGLNQLKDLLPLEAIDPQAPIPRNSEAQA